MSSSSTPSPRPSYGRTLLKLVEHAASPASLASPVSFPACFPAVSGIIQNNADLKRTIAMIAAFRPRSRASSITARSSPSPSPRASPTLCPAHCNPISP